MPFLQVACHDMFQLMDRRSTIEGLEPTGDVPNEKPPVTGYQGGNLQRLDLYSPYFFQIWMKNVGGENHCGVRMLGRKRRALMCFEKDVLQKWIATRPKSQGDIEVEGMREFKGLISEVSRFITCWHVFCCKEQNLFQAFLLVMRMFLKLLPYLFCILETDSCEMYRVRRFFSHAPAKLQWGWMLEPLNLKMWSSSTHSGCLNPPEGDECDTCHINWCRIFIQCSYVFFMRHVSDSVHLAVPYLGSAYWRRNEQEYGHYHYPYKLRANDKWSIGWGFSTSQSSYIYIYIIENSERSVDIMTCIAANGVLYMNGTDSKSVTLDSGSVQNTQDWFHRINETGTIAYY